MPLIPLQKAIHSALTFSAVEDYSSTAAMLSMPLMPFEVSEASYYFTIIFPAKGSAVPHALLGLGDKNIFVDEKGKWTGGYLPLYAANYPFSIMMGPEPEDGSPPRIILCIDDEAPHFKQKKGSTPLYTPTGEESELLQRIKTGMAQQFALHTQAEPALAQLVLSGAIREQVVSLGPPSSADSTGSTGGAGSTGSESDKPRSVGGLHLVDRKHIMSLPDADLGAWAKVDVLEMLFAHWGSFRHLPELLNHPSCPAPGKKK